MHRYGKRLFTLLLTLALASVVLAACGADNDEETGALEDEGFGDENLAQPEVDVEATAQVAGEPTTQVAPAVEPTPTALVTETVEMTPTTAAQVAATEETTTTTTVTEAQTRANPALIRSGNLIGASIVTNNGEEIAEVTDGLFDVAGNVHYLIVDLETDAEQTVAVSWDALKTQQQMAQTEPTALNIVFLGDDIETEPEVDAAVLDDDAPFIVPADLALDDDADRLLQLSEFDNWDVVDYNLVTADDDDIGEIEQVVVNLNSGKIVYALADIGGFLGVGEQMVAIPWNQLSFDQAEEDFVVNASEEQLNNAPEIDLDNDFDPLGRFDENVENEIKSFWTD